LQEPKFANTSFQAIFQAAKASDNADIKENISNTRPPRGRRQVQSLQNRIGSTLDFILSAPYELFTELWNVRDVNSWHVPKQQLERVMNRTISPIIPMNYFKDVKDLHNVTFTTLILECFTAASRKFMMEAGFSVPEAITCVSMLPDPGHPDKLRNRLYV